MLIRTNQKTTIRAVLSVLFLWALCCHESASALDFKRKAEDVDYLQRFLVTPVATWTGLLTMTSNACANMTLMEGFNFRGFQGTWYEMYRSKTIAEERGDCHEIQISKIGNDDFQMRHTEKKRLHDGTFTPQTHMEFEIRERLDENNKTVPARLEILRKHVDGEDWAPFDIVTTDFDTFAVVYSCHLRYGGLMKDEKIWVLTRNPLRPEEKADEHGYLSNKVKSIIEENIDSSINFEEYMRPVFQNRDICQYPK